MKRLAALAFALLCPLLAAGQYNSYTAFAAGTAPSYAGLWWNPSESGWGVSVAHQGDVVFAVWYTYDRAGQPTWFFMPEARLVGDDMQGANGMMDMEMMGSTRNAPMYTGALYRSTLAAGKPVSTQVGTATLLFKDRTHAAFAYTVGGVSQSKSITRMEFAQANQQCTLGGEAKAGSPNYQDLWWNPYDPGWGVGIAHQGDTIFATYFTYAPSGWPEWYVMPNTARYDAGTMFTGYTGPMLRATGPAFDLEWDASKVSLTEVGPVTFLMNARGDSSFYTRVDGVAQYPKGLTRMMFAAPATVCR